MALRTLIALAACGVLLALASPVAAASPEPWETAADVRTTLAGAQRALVLGEPATARRLVADAAALELGPLGPVTRPGLAAAEEAVSRRDSVGLEIARAATWTAILGEAARRVLAATVAGEVERARAWLLVREFRKPTRFTRPGADATLALRALEDGRMAPQPAAASARADLLDTYQARLRAALERVASAGEEGFDISRSGAAALARGYFEMLSPAYAEQRSSAERAETRSAFEELVAAARAGDDAAVSAAQGRIDAALEGFRAAPLSEDEELRRAGQLERFLALVPIEYGRGVEDGQVTLDFEIQEAVTFRDGAAQAFGDLEHLLTLESEEDTRQLGELLDGLGTDLAAAARREAVADPDDVQSATDEALGLIDGLYPDDWKDAGATADFDVISATLDRLEGAMAAGQFGQAEQARLEAYAFFEFGPEQRLRGLANDLFVEVEGLLWYGADGLPGLAQLVKRKAGSADVAETRQALDAALADAEVAVGAGPTSTFAVVSNTAVIVFREGLEAVLILAALMAGMTGSQARLRRPLLAGAAAAFVASMITWAIAQTVLGSLSRYGEKLEALVSLIAVGVLLILNWFYHRVYWSEHLAGLHGRKKQILGIGVGVAAAQLVGLGLRTVLAGVALGLAATLAVGVLTIPSSASFRTRRC
jgi:high-affinity iron transporter